MSRHMTSLADPSVTIDTGGTPYRQCPAFVQNSVRGGRTRPTSVSLSAG